ncbi:MAG: hypothetical protein V2G48_07455 [bacterium JZ-2024 1]
MKTLLKKLRSWWKKFQRMFRGKVRDRLKEERKRLEDTLTVAVDRLDDEVLEAVAVLSLSLYRAYLLHLLGENKRAREEIKEAWRNFRKQRDNWLEFLKETVASLRSD